MYACMDFLIHWQCVFFSNLCEFKVQQDPRVTMLEATDIAVSGNKKGPPASSRRPSIHATGKLPYAVSGNKR